jgi:L-arabinokinase
MSSFPTVVFYVSGHGYGHAVRQIEIMNALAARRPDLRIQVRSDAPPGLFQTSLQPVWPVRPGPTDTGVVQIDSLQVDVEASVHDAWTFHAALDQRADKEAAWLAAQGTVLVAADIPPLAFAAAKRLGVPSVGLGNFTWDWIYRHYAPRVALPPELMPCLERTYATATAAWRLGMAAGFETFPQVHDAPLVARHATHAGAETRALLGLPADSPVVLVSFGRYGLSAIDWSAVRRQGKWSVVVTRDVVDTGPTVPPTTGPDVVSVVDLPTLFARGYRYADLVAAADVVLTKPGYGIIAECAANQTALVYTSRGDFAEYQVLVDAMPALLPSAYLEQSALFGGQWGPTIERVLGAQGVASPCTDGADVVAEGLDGLLRRPSRR